MTDEPDTCRRGHLLTSDNVYVRPSRPNQRECRTCHRKSVRSWQKSNPDRQKEYEKNWESRNPNWRSEWNKKYREENAIEIALAKIQWKKANPERMAELQRRGRIAYRARKAGVPSEPYTLQDIVDRDGAECGLCGEPIDLKLNWPDMWSKSIDHVIPISLGGPDVLDNVQLAHLLCNTTKGNRV